MLFKNGKKASYSEVYDDPDALIDAVSKSKLSLSKIQYKSIFMKGGTDYFETI